MVEIAYLLASIAFSFGIYLIVSLSLNLEYGFGGIPNFGRSLAVIMGAVAVGAIVNRALMLVLGLTGDIKIASGHVKHYVDSIIAQSPLLGIAVLIGLTVLAALLGAAVGALSVLPSARLKEMYLAITLFATAEVVFQMCYHSPDIIGGYLAVSVIDPLAWVPGEHRFFAYTALVLCSAAIIYLVIDRLTCSPFGRALRAMRESELVAEMFGRNVMSLRVKTVAIGSSVAAVAGLLYSIHAGAVSALTYERTYWTFYPWLMMLLGGLSNNLGVALGALIFVIVRELLVIYKGAIASALLLPEEYVPYIEYVLFGILMIVILMFRPQGLAPERMIETKPIRDLRKRRE